MKTIMLLITVLAVVSAALNSNDAVARLKTISKRDVRDSMEQVCSRVTLSEFKKIG